MADLALVTADRVRIVGDPAESGTLVLQAAEALAAGDAVYIDSNGKFAKADANGVGTHAAQYIVTRTVSAGMPVTGVRDGRMDGWDLTDAAYGDPVYLSDTAGKLHIGSAPAATDEVQTVTIDATGGTFTLSFRGAETTDIAFDAAAAAVQTALRALATIGSPNVTVSGSAGGPYTVTFVGTLAAQNLPALVSDPALLTGGAGTAVVAEQTAGHAQTVIGRVEPSLSQTIGTVPDKVLRVAL